ncbi:hypothetical protein [Rheinheimera sp. 1928-s]|uniref:hypothetical protein n=1 Tax=Rheinheimera sp. 1928-s TaxID=3033803 RepID=UPI00261EF08A|nr:hypothetical protein [Rheinheimera sp. 1928-s]MDF3125958.1 hypothetical protein [Rheinheimera sp. 1928-s]
MSKDYTDAGVFNESPFLHGQCHLDKPTHFLTKTLNESMGDTGFPKHHQMHKFDNAAFNLLYPDQLPQVLV